MRQTSSIFGKKALISGSNMGVARKDSLHYMTDYQHVNIVRAPSYMESSGQINQLGSSDNISSFFNSEMSLKKTNPGDNSGRRMEWIREEPANHIHS